MQARIFRVFTITAGVLLVLTASAKFISAMGHDSVLNVNDPILLIPFRYLFALVALIELAVALACFLGRKPQLQAALIAWLAVGFLAYRLGLLWIGYHRPCACLGSLSGALRIPPDSADSIMKGILAYLLVGSLMALLWHWKWPKGLAKINLVQNGRATHCSAEPGPKL